MFIRMFLCFTFLNVFTIGYSYLGNKSDIMWGTAFVSFLNFLFAFTITKDLDEDTI